MIEFVQATKEDILSICPQSSQDDSISITHGKDVFERGLIPLEGRAVAIHYHGIECIGAYGLTDMWPGVARAWALLSEHLITSYPVLLGLHIARDIRRAPKLGIRRVEATTSVDHVAGGEFLMRLGFVREGLMRCYSPSGEDMYLYAKVENVI